MNSVAQKVTRARSVEPINWILLIVSLLLLSVITVLTFRSLTIETHQRTATEEVNREITQAKADALDAPEVTILELNKKNQRLGPEVTVNPDNIGKDNPFVK